ncbi:basic leucine zipper 34-like [Senna tora]|uniref:Basic leucine zipper 34-like n=1 Tax=Senna tora TaxID=362788 RepID=A0A834T4W9_9FABA|nr:basic leucine zipper 34-like [Senna tora]
MRRMRDGWWRPKRDNESPMMTGNIKSEMVNLMEIEAASSEVGQIPVPPKELPSTDLSLGSLGSYFEASWPLQNHENEKLPPPAGDAMMETDMNVSDIPPQVDMNLENLTLDDEEVDESPNPHEQGQAIDLDKNRKFYPDMDPKRLKRILSNRISAKKSRNKKNQYIADMEKQAEMLESKIAHLYPQIAAFHRKRHCLLIENHQVKYRMAALEKDRLRKEDEMERVKAELNMLKGIHWNNKMEQEVRMQESMMRRWGSDMKLMTNPTPGTPSPVEPVLDSNSGGAAVRIEEEKSEESEAAIAKLRYKEKGKAKLYEI